MCVLGRGESRGGGGVGGDAHYYSGTYLVVSWWPGQVTHRGGLASGVPRYGGCV